jgi:3-hydroxyisobutyrate dehydrogenase
MSTQKIGVVGLGRMGANMARRLREVGYPVVAVYDLRPDLTKSVAAELGAEPCERLARVTELAEVILTVVSDDKAQLKVFSDRKDSLLRKAKGRVFLNCATLSPETHVKVAELASKAGAETLECLMASSIPQARAGTLYLMCGGSEATFRAMKPLLTKLSDEGRLLRHVGGPGRGAQVKALVNMVMNINTAGLAEGLGLGQALGLDPKLLLEVFSQTGANSRVVATDGEDMVNREHSCYFSAAHAAKDSGIACRLAEKAQLRLPLSKATFGQYRRMMKLGLGELDKSGVAELTFKGRA